MLPLWVALYAEILAMAHHLQKFITYAQGREWPSVQTIKKLYLSAHLTTEPVGMVLLSMQARKHGKKITVPRLSYWNR